MSAYFKFTSSNFYIVRVYTKYLEAYTDTRTPILMESQYVVKTFGLETCWRVGGIYTYTTFTNQRNPMHLFYTLRSFYDCKKRNVEITFVNNINFGQCDKIRERRIN